MDAKNIWRIAQELVEEHDFWVPQVIEDRALDFATENDVQGMSLWMRIGRAIEELQREERRDGEAVN